MSRWRARSVHGAWLGVVLSLALVGLQGCDASEKAPSQEPPVDHGEAPTDPLGARVHAIGLERVGRYTPAEIMHRGELDHGQVSQHPEVLLGTHCYVVIAVGDDSLRELAITVLDPTGAPVLQDPTRGPEAIVGLRSALCPPTPGEYKIRLRAYAGEGGYAVRVYGQRAL